MTHQYDVIVVGAGHAGLEAAFIAAKFNLKVGLFSLNKAGVANIPCNPSIGGPAKGVVTREIDALGGIQGIATDANKIQNKKVNFSKGPGVWAYRAQIDKGSYHQWFLEKIDENPNISLIIGEVVSLIKEDDKIVGIKTKDSVYYSQAVIITTGTYLRSELYHDKKFADSGPDNNPNSNFLSLFFLENDIELIRLKTGTSPRIFTDTIDFSKMAKDDDNNDKISFSFQQPKTLPLEDQFFCYLTETTDATKEFIEKNKHHFGICNGAIDGTGPRYCPSIEDKYIRFPHRLNHHIFVEPVDKTLEYYYLAGLSTSLCKEMQLELIKTIKGFENAKIKTYAYAIVYDAINPIQLDKTLELRKIKNLYFAGQVNGTSGYEEAAAQGLMAGINASLKILQKPPFILKRNEAYIGVLIDDLTSKGVSEPYRLLTSRAEFRLLLRNDNADERLMKYGHQYGLIDGELAKRTQQELQNIEFNIDFFKKNTAAKFGLVGSNEGTLTLFSWLCRPGSEYSVVEQSTNKHIKPLSPESIEKLLIKIKYEGYIRVQEQKINKLEKWKNLSLVNIQNYDQVVNLSSEAREKLNIAKPITIYDALQISGININDAFWIKNFIDTRV